MKNTATTQIIDNITDIKERIREFKEKKLVIGLVPTMGALHIGHESLIQKAKEECDMVITSIFVNPTQFGPMEDFNKYPRQLEADREICSKLGVDLIFAPSPEEMYPQGLYSIGIDFTMVVPPAVFQNTLCGISRIGHFNGVATVVLKLLNIINPDKAYFGRKDAQQFVIIKKMVKDLNLPVQIIDCPIIRESDGLACSSRNKYLNEAARKKAGCIYKSLQKVEELYNTGITQTQEVIAQSKELLPTDMEVEYFEALDMDTFLPAKEISKNTLVAIAIKLDGVRLIDNLVI